MPPIKLHLDDPITPTKPVDGAITNATPTSANTTSAPPPPRPGAAAFPAPTPFAAAPRPPPTRTIELEPEETSANSRAPAPPQPGAVPVPPTRNAYVNTNAPLPPLPKAGETVSQRQQSPPQPQITAPPTQFSIPPPQQNLAPTHSTTMATQPATSRYGGPTTTTLNLGPVQPHLPQPSVQHPTGYQQNLFAQDMSPAQRASMETQNRDEGVLSHLGGALSGKVSEGFGGVGGGGGGNGGGGGFDGEDEGVWGAVKGWASKAGQSLAETEQSVWKKINGQ